MSSSELIETPPQVEMQDNLDTADRGSEHAETGGTHGAPDQAAAPDHPLGDSQERCSRNGEASAEISPKLKRARQSDLATAPVMMVRNVIILGKIGVGKSTLANRIVDKDPEAFEVSSNIQSVTRLPRLAEATTFGEFDGVKFRYKLKLIDTVGRYNSEQTKEVMKDLKKYFNEEVPEGVNLVIFVVGHGRLSIEEENIFDYIIRHFKHDIAGISALVITRCEGMTADAKEEYIGRFEKNPETRQIAEVMKKGIYAVGFPDFASLPQELRDIYESQVKEDQGRVRRLVANAAEMRIPHETFSEGSALAIHSRPTSKKWTPCRFF